MEGEWSEESDGNVLIMQHTLSVLRVCAENAELLLNIEMWRQDARARTCVRMCVRVCVRVCV